MTTYTYRLDPIQRDHPSWELSTFKDAVWAAAESYQAARDLVAQQTMVFHTVKPGEAKLVSPWFDARVTSCVWYPDKTDVPENAVFSLDGKPINSK